MLQLNVFLFPPPCLPGSCRDKVTFKVMYVLLVNKRYKDQTIFATIVGVFVSLHFILMYGIKVTAPGYVGVWWRCVRMCCVDVCVHVLGV